MILNISIPDEVYIAYGAFGYHRPHQAIADQLKRWSGVDPKDSRVLVLSGEQRDQLEKTLGRTIDSAEMLLKEAKAVAELKIGEGKIELPIELQKYYAGQADFFGKGTGEFLREKVLQLLRANAGQGAY